MDRGRRERNYASNRQVPTPTEDDADAQRRELKELARSLLDPSRRWPGLFLTDPYPQLHDSLEERWNKRGYYEQNRGWYSPKDAVSPNDPTHWYLPSADKGEWLGAKGDSAFRLKEPINVNGRLVREIQYMKGLPVLEKFALPGKTASIVLTGDTKTDIRNAKSAWQELNPGKPLPEGATFHHDLLHVAEQTVTNEGKKTKILVGKMHLVPNELHKTVFHEGSASVAYKFYRGLGMDIDAVKRLAAKEAPLAGKAGSEVGRAVKKIVPGKLTKGILPFIGRGVRRVLPIVGTGLAILEFPANVEAHGVAGAVARATPVLGDLISAHDLGSDLAKQITDDANEKLSANLRALNEPVADAWREASQQTIQAFNELAPQIEVTNEYGQNGLVDPDEIKDALRIYRSEMQHANYMRNAGAKTFDYAARAAQNKEEFKERLTRACQQNGPRRGGPAM
jgi:hypothetical protein